MTVKQIVADYLKAHDCDGLVGDKCGCSANDLFLCESDPRDCLPAWSGTATAYDQDAGFEGEVGDHIFREADLTPTPENADPPVRP
jgi:hypothetical protein